MVGKIENEWRSSATRRTALRNMAMLLAASPLLRAQQDRFRDHPRVARLDELVNAFDFEQAAFDKLSRDAYNYTAYGSESEFTLRRNREAFDWVDLVPKRFVDVSSVQTATEILGTKMAFPIMIAPTAGHQQLHPQGEPAMSKGAAAAANTPLIVSNNSSTPLDQIVAAEKTPMWWQLYPREDLNTTRSLLETAQTNGAQAIVVTIDQQSAFYERAAHDRNLGNRTAAARIRPSAGRNPYRIVMTRLWYSWQYFDQIRPFIKVPMLAKGILSSEDALLCLDHGIDGIVVSNHGGRSMDYGPSTLEVLPEIVDAVKGRIPVLIDGGFRRGSDILKALALGAKAVCLGRVPRWGLGAYGSAGVQKVLEIMQAELALAMAQTGCPTLASINRSFVRTDFS